MKNLIRILLIFALLPLSVLAQDTEEPILSGQVQSFSDPSSQLSVKVPVEFKLPEAGGPLLMFMGPLYQGGALSIHINTVPMPGMSSDSLYGVNWKQKKNDKNYTDLQEVSIVGGKAFSFKEVDQERGGTPKTDDAIHRWHLLAFGQGKFYNCILAGSFGGFQDPLVTSAYEAVMKSFAIK